MHHLLVLCLLALLGPACPFRVSLPGLGSLVGSTNRTLWTERPIYQFQGIPFAKPPSGSLRFKPPEPAEPWTGELNATSFRRRCPQALNMDDIRKMMSSEEEEDIEDCLHLNVYTNQVPGECRGVNPVMFWIHGGSFRVGSARSFRPNYLLERDVVLVVTQYRLGPLGFLSFQNDDISGNMGLLDVTLALEWVQEHIAKFCGDPSQVTIFGQSSGGAAVSLFLASPLAKEKRLFQRAIIQSGSGLCDWATDAHPVRTARGIASYLPNCSGTDTQLTQCLVDAKPHAILKAHYDYLRHVLKEARMAVNGGIGGNHAVVQTAGRKKFLVESPFESYLKGNFLEVPIMVGVTKHEGTFFLGNIYDFFSELNSSAMNSTDFLRNEMIRSTLLFSGFEDTTGALTEIFTDKFFTKDQLGNFTKMTYGLVDLCGMALLKSCIFQTAKRQYLRAPTFLYSFNYFGHLTKFGYGEEVDYPFSGGVAHSDDLVYLFPMDSGTLTDDEKQIADTMVKLWTNFASKGDPNPIQAIIWKAMSTNYGPYLRIDNHTTLRPDFALEFNITIQEGLGKIITTSSALSLTTIVPNSILLLLSLLLIIMVHV